MTDTMPDTMPDPEEARRAPSRRVARTLGGLGFAALAGAALLAASARWFWLGEVATSFAWYIGLAGALGAAFLLALGRRRLALGALLIAGSQVAPELWLYVPARTGPSSTPELRLASCNLLASNPEGPAFVRWLERNEPDVVLCLEATPEWLEVLQTQRDRYPFVQLSPEPERWSKGTYGAALLSRLPFDSSRIIPLASPGVQAPIEAVVRFAGRSLTIRGAHAPRPGRAWRTARRNAFLEELGRLPWDDACILAGDLNTTSSSPIFPALLAATSLRDSRQGFGRQPSFPVTRFFPLGAIAIDHVLVGDALHVIERETSAVPGSDHRTVLVRLGAVRPASGTDALGLRGRPGIVDR